LNDFCIATIWAELTYKLGISGRRSEVREIGGYLSLNAAENDRPV